MITTSSIKVIDSFRGEYRFLSNFFPAPVCIKDLYFPTSEHAFQFLKLPEENKKLFILSDDNKYTDVKVTPGQIKRFSRDSPMREDWDSTKVLYMYIVVRLKFIQNPELKALLLQTGNAILIEGNNWGDEIWGQCDPEGGNLYRTGLNLLGKILMLVRDELRLGAKP